MTNNRSPKRAQLQGTSTENDPSGEESTSRHDAWNSGLDLTPTKTKLNAWGSVGFGVPSVYPAHPMIVVVLRAGRIGDRDPIVACTVADLDMLPEFAETVTG